MNTPLPRVTLVPAVIPPPPPPEVCITMSYAHAEALKSILGKVGGHPETSYRKYAADLHEAVNRAGIGQGPDYERVTEMFSGTITGRPIRR